MVLSLWTMVGPPMTWLKGYAPMKSMGWGEDLPRDVYYQWRTWCLTKEHFKPDLRAHHGFEKFEDFRAPIVAIYPTDDYIANHRTVDASLEFYPASIHKKITIAPKDMGVKKIGHTGIFRSRSQKTIWPIIVREMELD
jgi:predicted alpha/beta hydrolase